MQQREQNKQDWDKSVTIETSPIVLNNIISRLLRIKLQLLKRGLQSMLLTKFFEIMR